MSTTVTYKGVTLTTADNQTRTLLTAGKYLEDNVTITDTSSSYEDGDNMGYGDAGAVGTWYFNSSPDLTDEVLYHIDFTANNISFDGLELYNHYEIDYYQNGSPELMAYYVGSWQADYRTITITGGADASNANFIAWMQNNATKQ